MLAGWREHNVIKSKFSCRVEFWSHVVPLQARDLLESTSLEAIGVGIELDMIGKVFTDIRIQ